jgi:hypothetical protein
MGLGPQEYGLEVEIRIFVPALSHELFPVNQKSSVRRRPSRQLFAFVEVFEFEAFRFDSYRIFVASQMRQGDLLRPFGFEPCVLGILVYLSEADSLRRRLLNAALLLTRLVLRHIRTLRRRPGLA